MSGSMSCDSPRFRRPALTLLVGWLAIIVIAASCGDSSEDASATTASPTPTTASATATSDDPPDDSQDTQPAGTEAPATTAPVETSPPATEGAPVTEATTPAGSECGTGGPTADEGLLDGTFTMSNGDERTYQIDTPPGYEEGTEAAFVFNFHGRGSNSLQQWLYGNFIDLAAADGVFLVMPQAMERNGAVQWSPGLPGEGLDIDYIDELLTSLRSEYCVGDVFAAGMSSGGGMSSALACWADSPFAGFGPVTLAYYDPDLCGEAPPRPFVYFHGTDDDTVPFDGSENGLDAAPVTAQEWAEHNGCSGEGEEERLSEEVLLYTWQGCAASTEFYVVEGGNHTWPGAVAADGLGYVTDDINASEIIWDLFFAG